jgi:hypothetical protein
MDGAKPRLAVASVVVAGLALGACGSGGAARVIGPSKPPVTNHAATTTTVPPTTTVPVTPVTAAPTTTTTVAPPPATPTLVSPNVTAQLNAELNALSTSLNQAQSDLSNQNTTGGS